MIINEYAQKMYKWEQNYADFSTFVVTKTSFFILQQSRYHRKEIRKEMRAYFFCKGFGCERCEVRIYLNDSLRIQKHKLHSKITKCVKTSELTAGQREKYKYELLKMRVWFRLQKSQLRFTFIPETEQI